MGRCCGLGFYEVKGNELVKAPIDDSPFWIYGRCEATGIFLDAVTQKENPSHWKANRKREDRYSAYLLLNHPEFDGLMVHCHEDRGDFCLDWFKKYFYVGLKEFQGLFDFEAAQREHDNDLAEVRGRIAGYQKEIEGLRIHQENAKTKASFAGFEARIKELRENIRLEEGYLRETEEDDYGYEHYMHIKRDLELAEDLMKKDHDLIVVAFASD